MNNSLKALMVLMSFMVLWTGLTAQNPHTIDGVIWIVGDEPILRSDVEQARIRAQYEGSRVQGDPYCVFPEQLAIRKLFLHQAKIDSISANQGQVEMQVNAQVNYYVREIGSTEKLEEYFGKSISEIKDEMRVTVEEDMIISQVRQGLVDKVKVTPSEVRRFYNGLEADSIPTVAAQVEVQIITLEPPIPEETIEETKQRLRDFADRVNSGDADFSMLARLYSEDDASARQGGELGFMGRGNLVPEFASAAFALTEPGKVSRVIETEFGYHIIQLIEKRDDKVNCRHILLRPKVSAEIKQKTFDSLDSIATAIRTGKLTFEEAASAFSSDKETKMNGGNMVNTNMTNVNMGSSHFEYQELPPEIAKMVYGMKEGEISVPFSMFNQKLGREVYAIVKVKKKLENHKANLSDDFQVIKTMCENKKREEVIEEWINNKIKDTYIMIAPEWRGCDFRYKSWVKE